MKNKELENKYFTPEIEDIHVGYEAEIAYLHEDNWTPTKWRHSEETLATISSLFNYNRRIRVPYLTKEQIESEGWNIVEQGGHLIKAEKGRYFLRYFSRYPEEYALNIYFNHDGLHGGLIFAGICKDINTLRTIQKLLKI